MQAILGYILLGIILALIADFVFEGVLLRRKPGAIAYTLLGAEFMLVTVTILLRFHGA